MGKRPRIDLPYLYRLRSDMEERVRNWPAAGASGDWGDSRKVPAGLKCATEFLKLIDFEILQREKKAGLV